MTTNAEKKPATPSNQTPATVKKQTEITEKVLSRIKEHQDTGLRLPPDYAPENALKSAYLVLQEVKDRSGKPVLESCSPASIANSLFEMAVRGLSPLKKQCYFIAYGDKLTLSPSYFGNIATAKRCGLKNIVANVIYEGDEFVFSLDTTTGRRKVEKHEQKLENIDINKIKGAYAVFELSDGHFDLEIMSIQQVKQAWLQGAAKGNSGAHTNFTDEMAKKSVINRACKRIINSSDDSYLYDEDEKPTSVIAPNANSEEITMDGHAEVVDDKPTETAPEQAPEQPEQGNTEAGQGTIKGPGF